MTTSINDEFLIDIFTEISKTDDFYAMEKLFLSSKNALKICLKVLKCVKSVTNDFPFIIFSFDSFTWKFKHFPQSFWKYVAPFIPELIIINDAQRFFNLTLRNMVDENKLEFSQLQKVQVKCLIGHKVWELLLDTPVEEVSESIFTWNSFIIGCTSLDLVREEAGKKKRALLETIEILIDDDENIKIYPNTRLEFCGNIPSKNLFINSVHESFWINIYRSFQNTGHKSPDVKTFKICFNDAIRVLTLKHIGLTALLENINNVFPNLEKVEMCVITKFENFFGYDTKPGFAKPMYKVLANLIKNADIDYKLSLSWIRIGGIQPTDNFHEFCETLINFGFIKNYDQNWSKDLQIAENKRLIIEFNIEEKNIPDDGNRSE